MARLTRLLVLASILPLLLAMASIGAILAQQSRDLAAEQQHLMHDSLLTARQTALRNYLALARTVVERSADQDAAKALLGEMTYGTDGYFFAYDAQGRSLVHPRQSELVGRNLWSFTDPAGHKVIQELLAAPQQGGFVSYLWQRPSDGAVVRKLGYVEMVPRYGWLIGTGLYLDEIDNAMGQVQTRFDSSLSRTAAAVGGVALVSTLLMGASLIGVNLYSRAQSNRKIRSLAQGILTAQEDERARLSRELHDGISQNLVALKMRFEVAQLTFQRLGIGANPELAHGIKGLAGTLAEVRRISHGLRPAELDDLGLVAALQQMTFEFAQRTGLHADFYDESDAVAITDETSQSIFRIVQEALTNIETHAGAHTVMVRLGCADGLLHIRVSDDGQGCDAQAALRGTGSGIGLQNIAERAAQHGGTLRFVSEPGQTLLDVSLALADGRG